MFQAPQSLEGRGAVGSWGVGAVPVRFVSLDGRALRMVELGAVALVGGDVGRGGVCNLAKLLREVLLASPILLRGKVAFVWLGTKAFLFSKCINGIRIRASIVSYCLVVLCEMHCLFSFQNQRIHSRSEPSPGVPVDYTKRPSQCHVLSLSSILSPAPLFLFFCPVSNRLLSTPRLGTLATVRFSAPKSLSLTVTLLVRFL